jgi:tRNA dimethylallyltransferase
MQVYKGMDIGTAKPTEAERGDVPHHLLDVALPSEAFSAARYQLLARGAIAEIRARGRVPILAGGTGFYINAVVYGTEFAGEEEKDSEMRSRFMALAAEKGAAYLHGLLAGLDPEAAAAIHPNNIKRVARALAFCQSTGTRFSAHNTAQREKKERAAISAYGPVSFTVLTLPRPLLYDRINGRVREMLAAGLIQEVAALLAAGYSPDLPAMQGIGYKETAAFLTGAHSPAGDIASAIAQATRRYAKRQLTWFRHGAPHARWLDVSSKSAEEAAKEILTVKEQPPWHKTIKTPF